MQSGSGGEWSPRRVLIEVPIGLAAYATYFLIGLLANRAPPTAFALGIAALVTVFGLVLFDRLFALHGFRTALLTVTQRKLAYLLVGLVLGAIVASITYFAVPPWDFVRRWEATPFIAGMSQLTYLIVVEIAVVTAATWLGWYWFDRVEISAAHCHTVLRRIARQWDTGAYRFELGATWQEIRQEGRFLDYLARHSDKTIRSHLFRGYTFTPFPSHAPSGFQTLCAAIAAGDSMQAAQHANAYWRACTRCKRIGDKVHAVKEDEFAGEYLFGNKLDMLFNGGKGFQVHAPQGPNFITMAIKGPPGAGKSTQALQLCVALAKQGHYCVYFSLEEEREGLLRSAHNFTWADPASVGAIAYAGVQRLDSSAKARSSKSRQHGSTTASSQLNQGGVWISSLGDRAMPVRERKRQLHREWAAVPEVPRCVVIDSLEGFSNVGLDRENPAGVPRDELLALKDFFRDRCQMLIILVEDDGSGKPGYVDFVSDVVIRLGRTVGDDYTILIAEILKARNQTHALGPHQIKIRSQADILRAAEAVAAGLEGLHPGIIVFPSLHYWLFQSQHQPTSTDYVLSTGLDGLDDMLPGIGGRHGARRKSAMAMLGPSGSAKSVLALNFLIEGVRENTPALLLLLHNDRTSVYIRNLAQDPQRMHFSWRPYRDAKTGKDEVYHQFEWTIEGIAHWSRGQAPLDGPWHSGPIHAEAPADAGNHVPARIMRLPYLFQLKPVSQPITAQRIAQLENLLEQARGTGGEDRARAELERAQSIIQQARAVHTLLHAVGRICPPADASGRVVWTAAARRALRVGYEDAWSTFLNEVGPESLVLGINGQPKHLELMHADSERDEDPSCPFLIWDSRYGKVAEPGSGDRVQIGYDTRLLTIRDFRPGNIAPEDFVDRLIRDIGEPKQESPVERVVVDNVSQLSQRFPLLAKSQLFLPALIDLFKATGITSLFLADIEGRDSDGEEHGIAIIGDQVMRTKISSNGKRRHKDNYEDRQIILEIDAPPNPDDDRQAPHAVKLTNQQSRFDASEEEHWVTLERLAHHQNSGSDGTGPSFPSSRRA